MADFGEDFDTQTHRVNKEVAGLVKYIGYALNQDTADGDAKWLIKRIAVSGGLLQVQYASEKFDQIWNNRVSLFGAPPFDNENSLLFDGVNDFVTMGDVAPLSFERTNSFSISLWFRSSSSSDQVLFSKQGGGNSAGYRFNIISGRLEFHLSGGAAGNRIEVRSPLSTYADGSWHHVAVTYSGTSTAAGCKMYVDGAEVTLTVITDTLVSTMITTNAAIMGGRATGTTNSFSGFMDEPSVWNAVLSLTHVGNIYNAGVVGDLNQHAAALNLTAWWRNGDNDTSPTIMDTSNVGNNLDGTMTNMTASSIVGEVP